jgi:hypothetical protein
MKLKVYLFLLYLTTISEYVTSNNRLAVNNELKEMWKEAVFSQLKVLLWHLPGGTEKNNEIPRSG